MGSSGDAGDCLQPFSSLAHFQNLCLRSDLVEFAICKQETARRLSQGFTRRDPTEIYRGIPDNDTYSTRQAGVVDTSSQNAPFLQCSFSSSSHRCEAAYQSTRIDVSHVPWDARCNETSTRLLASRWPGPPTLHIGSLHFSFFISCIGAVEP